LALLIKETRNSTMAVFDRVLTRISPTVFISAIGGGIAPPRIVKKIRAKTAVIRLIIKPIIKALRIYPPVSPARLRGDE